VVKLDTDTLAVLLNVFVLRLHFPDARKKKAEEEAREMDIAQV
jgi:hypothetical protein